MRSASSTQPRVSRWSRAPWSSPAVAATWRSSASRRRLRTRLTDAAPENFCRPAVDVLFRSLARTAGGGVLGVVLTGMGSDGTAGAADLVKAGATMWAQDEASSVVWGMPGSLVNAGLADEVMPLDAVGPALAALLHTARQPGSLTSAGPARG